MKRREFLAITACAACGAVGVGPVTPLEEKEERSLLWKDTDWPAPYRVALETDPAAARANIRKTIAFDPAWDTAYMEWSEGTFSPDIDWLLEYSHELKRLRA